MQQTGMLKTPAAVSRIQSSVTTLTLLREDWDFSSLPVREYLPALVWETDRECRDRQEIVEAGKAWLSGTLSDHKPHPDFQGKRQAKHLDYFSEVAVARTRVHCIFQTFIPTQEFTFLRRWSTKQRRAAYDRWLAEHLQPLLENYKLPWLRFSEKERLRLCGIVEKSRDTNIAAVESWAEVIGYFQRKKMDPGLPLVIQHDFTFRRSTTLLLTINWGYSRKRILRVVNRILDQYEPQDIRRHSSRGRKNRDRLVALERIGMMRLLHHYTCAELRAKLPAAWALYATRKWYDERRRVLNDFRDRTGFGENSFPISWETKAQRLGKRAARNYP